MDGLVVRQLSPFEQQVITPFFKYFPEEVLLKVKEGAWDILPAFVILYGVMTWGKSYHEDLCFHHRD